MKSSSGWASCRLPLLLWTWSSITIFSWSPWPWPRLGECGWDKKEYTFSCRVNCGSNPSFSELRQTCRSRAKPSQFKHERDSAVLGEATERSLTGMQLHSSEKQDYKPKTKKNISFNLNNFSLVIEYWWNKENETLFVCTNRIIHEWVFKNTHGGRDHKYWANNNS